MVLDRDSDEALRFYESTKETSVRLGVSRASILHVCTDTKTSTTDLGWRFARLEDQGQGRYETVVLEKELKRRMRESILVRKSDAAVRVCACENAFRWMWEIPDPVSLCRAVECVDDDFVSFSVT